MVGKLLPLIVRNVVTLLIITVCSICFNGCSVVKDVRQDDPFRRLYSMKPVLSSSDKSKSAPLLELTLSCHKMPIGNFSRILSDRFGVGVVYSDQLDKKTISAEFKKTDLESVLNVVGRQLSVDIVRVGNTYFIGQLRSEDRGILVRTVLGHDVASLQKIIASVLSEKGKSVVTGALVVVTDHESVLRRVAELLDYLDAEDADTWILQLSFVVLRKDAILEGGLDVSSSGTLAYNISDNSFEVKDIKLDALFNLGASSRYADIYASPMLVLRDGVQGNWKDGQRTPIPKKTVSNYGVVTTSGYDYVDTGFSVDATVTRSKRGGRVKLSIELSDVKSMVEEAPVTSQSVVTLDADLISGRIYLLGELSTYKILDGQSQMLDFKTDRGKSVLQVWAQLYRISGTTSERPVIPYLKSDITMP